ncbi:hypothetical protein [Pseudomonas sp. S2_H01]|jgi:hypothetical protein
MLLMDHSDERVLKEVLVKWYGPQARTWDINESVVKVLMEMLEKMHRCTSIMHFVPMPTTFGSQIGQLTKAYLKKVIGILNDHTDVYLTCSRSIILGYRTKMQEASLGL